MDKKTELKKLVIRDPQDPSRFILTSKEFTANGSEYVITDSVSVDRWMMLEEFELEFGLGKSLRQIQSGLRESWDAANEQRFGDTCVTLYNMMKGIADIDEKRFPTVIKICSLFINKKGEDIRYYSQSMMEEKAKDWREEGIDMQSFFSLAVSFIPDFTPIYEGSTKDIFLKKVKKNQE